MQADTFYSHLRIINVNAPHLIGDKGEGKETHTHHILTGIKMFKFCGSFKNDKLLLKDLIKMNVNWRFCLLNGMK